MLTYPNEKRKKKKSNTFAAKDLKDASITSLGPSHNPATIKFGILEYT
jgi:hypothetical protein